MVERICQWFWAAYTHHAFSSEWKNERVREDESGDSEDGGDELSCVIGGEREGDSMRNRLSTEMKPAFDRFFQKTYEDFISCRL